MTGDIGASGNLHANGLLVSSNILFYDALQNTQSGRTVADQNGCYYGP